MQRIVVPASLLPCLLLATVTSHAQTVINIDSPQVAGTNTVIAGYHYKRSGYHNLFWGKHYRREWATTVRVNNFFLDTAKGGLTPVKESGSRQSKGLRLKSTQGKEYVIRSVDKDFGNGLGEKFEGTFMARIAKDQASIGHPYAAPSIAAMIGTTGIYHTNPQIVFVPRQAALGEFNDEYGNQLYVFEERPDENQADAPWFGNSKNVIGTEKLLEKVFDDNDNRVDQRAFAKARLFDMFIGDWGRHADQWRWAEFETDSGTIYRPVPRDRDQAYTVFDGFWPWLATNFAGPGAFLESFDGKLNNVKKFNKPGRPLDRRFLTELSKEEWIAVANELQASLTDQVIENGIRQMPPAIFALSGEKLIAALKSRRDQLQQYAVKYYAYLAQHVVLVGSQKNEVFDINRLNEKETRITIYKKNKEGEVKSKPYYSRLFNKDETSTIRIYTLEGNDKITMTGTGDIRLAVIDPEGSDSIAIRGRRRISVSLGRRFEYDTVGKKQLDFAIMPLLSPREYAVFDDDALQLFTRIGIKLSLVFRLIPRPWQKDEFENEHMVSLNWGFIRGTIVGAYVGRFRQAVGKWDILLKARADLPAVENFFGVSNRIFDGTNGKKIDNPFYRTESTRLYGGIALSRDMGIHHITFGPLYQYVKVSDRGDHFITNGFPDRSVFDAKQFAGVEAGYLLKKTDNEVYPTRGVQFMLSGGVMKNISDKGRSFVKGISSLAFYIPLGNSFTLAVRGGGAVMDGEADYYHLNTLGGNENLRGFPRERFFGRNSFYNNNEIRWVVNTHNYLFTGKMGLLAFLDNGRVWITGEESGNWHVGYGGGLILLPFNKVALVGTYGLSRETRHILLQAQVFF